VVSRWPLGATQVHDITHAKREPRRAIEVEIATPTGVFRMIAAHFGVTLIERRQQARRLRDISLKVTWEKQRTRTLLPPP
jgi:endonuclease/exonuclease/phosphatase family metal-dependent hydrolase